MTQRKVEFFSDGLKLAGILMLPAGHAPGQRHPAVVICHGRFAIKEWVPSRWTPSLLAAGYACLVFDYRNLGESEGDPGTIIPQEEVRDVMHAVTFLTQQPEIDPERIGALGWGLGGGVLLSAAARDERIKAVVCASAVVNGAKYGRVGVSDDVWDARLAAIRQDRIDRVLKGRSASIPRSDVLGAYQNVPDANGQSWKDSLAAAVGAERASDPLKLGIPDHITLASLEALYDFLPDHEVDKIAPRPLLAIHSVEDDEFPFAHVADMYERAGGPKQLIPVRGAGHLDWIDPGHPSQQVYVPQVIDWMRTHLPV